MADLARQQIIDDACRRLGHLPTRTIATYLLHEYGPVFDGNLELIRNRVRHHLGENKNRKGKMLRPPRMPQTWREINKPFVLPPGKWLVLPDIHIPFHELKPIESAIQYGKDAKVDGIFLEGDAQDCAAVSFWPSRRRPKFDQEIEMFIDFLDFLDNEFKGMKKVYKFGNHEYRQPRYYAAKAPELIGLPLKAMDTVLGLEMRGYDIADYRQIVMAGKLPIIHGHEMRISTPVNPARGLFLKAKSWAACAHFHRTSEHTSTDIHGTILTTWSFGCLCDLSPDYNPFGNDWNWGFGILTNEKSGHFEVVSKRILPSGKVA